MRAQPAEPSRRAAESLARPQHPGLCRAPRGRTGQLGQRRLPNPGTKVQKPTAQGGGNSNYVCGARLHPRAGTAQQRGELYALLPLQIWCWRHGTCSASTTAGSTGRRRWAASSWWCGGGSPSPSPCTSRAGATRRGWTNSPSTLRRVSAAASERLPQGQLPSAQGLAPCSHACCTEAPAPSHAVPIPAPSPPGTGCCCAQLLYQDGEKR